MEGSRYTFSSISDSVGTHFSLLVPRHRQCIGVFGNGNDHKPSAVSVEEELLQSEGLVLMRTRAASETGSGTCCAESVDGILSLTRKRLKTTLVVGVRTD